MRSNAKTIYILLTGLFVWATAGANSLEQNSDYVLEIDEPLLGSPTAGTVNGGEFTDEGWKTLSRKDYIEWQIPTCNKGKVEFDVTGLYDSNDVFPNLKYYNGELVDDADVHYTLFNMWDLDSDRSWFGQYVDGIRMWHNPYKCMAHLFGFVEGDRWKWKHGRFRLNVSAFESGYDSDPHAFETEYGPIEWQRERVFRVKLVWGEGHMYYYINDTLQVHCDYSTFGEEYAPPEHMLTLGSAEHATGFSMQVPQLITYSNLKFYRSEDKEPPQVESFTPGDGEKDVDLTAYIALTFSESVNMQSVQNSFSIQPAVNFSSDMTGNTFYLRLDELLQPSTTYTVNLSNGVQDKSGNTLADPFTASFTTRAADITKVPQYDVFELPLVAANTPSNSYTDYTLHAVFTGPSQTIEIDGFWDGGNIWKVRMAPTEVGVWSYTITGDDPNFNVSGAFTCVDSDKKGFIIKNPANPYTFSYSDGTPFLWKGETSWRLYTKLLPYEGRFKEYIQLRHSQGYNVVQSIVVSYINGDEFWANEGGTAFELTSTGKNYNKLNPQYYQWIDRRIKYMNDLGMVPVIFFTWAQEYMKFTNAQFKLFEKYLVSRWAAYNVMWCICGEYNEAYSEGTTTASEWSDHGRYVYGLDPYDHIITYHPSGRGSCAEFGGTEWLGCIMHQTDGSEHNNVLNDRIYSKPVVNGEYAYPGWDEYGKLREGAWEVFTAGGFSTAGFFRTFAPDKGGWDPEADMQEQLEYMYYIEFVEKTRWWELQPHDELVTNAICAANPEKEYVIYSHAGGTIEVDLSAVSGTTRYQWLNPITGEYSNPEDISGGNTVSLTAPFSGEAVLHVGDIKDSMAPTAPKGLSVY
ncbi:MAG: DUF4038 domain-containing protein [candidate division KSB1 bacterium]|nr:DUF4038 domain-containing protein [candidate division KSB1 bacterium]